MLIILYVIVLLPLLPCVNTSKPNVLSKEIFIYNNETSFKAEFAYQVVKKIYNTFHQWFFTIIFCEFTYFENRILKYTETYDYGYPVILLDGCPNANKTRVKPKIDKHGKTAYIVTSNKLSLDVNDVVINTLKRTGVFKPRRAVIFVINIPVETDSYFNYDVRSHFQLLWSRQITNSVLLFWSGRLKMYTYNPFYGKVRDITEIEDVGQLLQQQYFDLYGHVLRLSVFKKIFLYDDPGQVHCDSKLAKCVMQRLNATCIPVVPRDENTVGDLLDNGTATGVTADLIDGFTDLELNSRILKNSFYGYIDTTYPLAQDELCFLVQKSGKQSTFTITLKLISTDILIIFIFNIFFFIAISLLVHKVELKIWNIKDKRTFTVTIVDLLKCFIKQTVNIKFLGPVFRFIVLMIIMYSLVINCAIDGILTSAITYPRYKSEMDTLTELANANLTLGVHNRYKKIFNQSLSAKDYKIFENRIEVINDRKIKEIIEERQFQYAILLRKSEAHYISRKPANMKNGRPLYHTMKKCPLPCSIVYGLRYGSPYLPRIDTILHQLNQAGILQYWTKTDEYTLFQKHGKVIYNGESKERKPLSMENLQEVFFVLLIGLMFATIAFFLEILFYSFNNT